MITEPLLIEIGCEEIPAGVVGPATAWLADKLATALAVDALGATAWSTPRRMAVHLASVPVRQADREVVATGPAVAVARAADGSWTAAAHGFARGQGVATDALLVVDTPKGPCVAARKQIAGRAIAALVADELPRLLRAMPLPKRMRWGAAGEPFVRPIHWIVALHGDAVIDLTFAGVRSGADSRGHRFYHPGPVRVTSDREAYCAALRSARVMVDPSERERTITAGAAALAASVEASVRDDAETLATVVQLVEWPAPLLGTFDPAFLEIPPEVIYTTLRENQKLFTLHDAGGRLLHRFVAVANTLGDHSRATVAAGNARVVSARLSDARFFYREDKKVRLADRVAALDARIYLQGLGSIGDRVRRLGALVATFGAGADPATAAAAARAALLCKADLTTRMVFEFPELQGTIGGDYARHDGEDAAVAQAIAAHYQPRFAGDALPAGEPARWLALADKLDAIAGCFALGLQPTGAQDPYSLRRAALGVLRILADADLGRGLDTLVADAIAALPPDLGARPALHGQVIAFLRGRLAALHGADHPTDAVEAVLDAGFDRPAAVAARLAALRDLRDSAEFAAIAAAFKRVANLVKKSTGAGDLGAGFDRALCQKPEEVALADAVEALSGDSERAIAAGDFAGALRVIARVRPAVDAFFDAVMVMVDDPTLRRNRVALLGRCAALVAPIADFSRLQG